MHYAYQMGWSSIVRVTHREKQVNLSDFPQTGSFSGS